MKRLNERGQLTMDFLLGIILVVGTAVLLGALSFALTLTEIVQYVTYSGARAYFAGDITKSAQANRGEAKVQRLLHALPFLTGAEANEWIKINAKAGTIARDYRQLYESNLEPDPSLYDRSQFEGVQLSFDLPLIRLNIPLIGAMKSSDDQGSIFRASSFLMREPSMDECLKYMSGAYQALLRAKQQTGSVPTNATSAQVVPILDNGC